jgi:D-alanyl-lipoteichoic acid acyltransferase DltB (MBOAT superfamily)
MLALNRSLLNREYTLIHVLKALASIISMCNLHVIFLSKITPRFYWQLALVTYSGHEPHRKQFFHCCITWRLRGPRREHRFSITPLFRVTNLFPSKGRVSRVVSQQRLSAGFTFLALSKYAAVYLWASYGCEYLQTKDEEVK